MRMDQQGKLRPEDRLGKFFHNQLVQVPAQRLIDTLYLRRDSLPLMQPDSNSLFVLVSKRNATGNLSVDTLSIGADSLMIVRKWERAAMRRPAYLFDLTIGELLSHHSGMPAGLPILPYLNYKDSLIGRYDRFFHPKLEEKYQVEVAGRFYLRNDYLDSLWEATKRIVPSSAKAYEYSDANLILVQQAIDSFNQEAISEYLDRELYQPLGMSRTCFLPLKVFSPEEIVPTEYDGYWRGQLLRGYVHDPTAALLGGVSGNAGLFSNANGLAHLFQMLLNLGHYGGERFLDDRIVREFTRRQYGHRGYGFDKPPYRGSDYIISAEASPNSFGHTGFTGTCVWADPDEELIFIFLSNRVHPRSSNWTLNELRIRQRIHDVVYAALP
jgi:CubicO group peptidase (beta-lactamase class C family)